MEYVKDYFGCRVFNDRMMKERLPAEIYRSLHATVERGAPLEVKIANAVAEAMKDWALENGATHFTHWFQPLTGITSEKHDSFIHPTPDGGVLMEFSGKELVRGEPDASSFPSGGLRATCEARGYTAWDPTSYAFLKDGVLCIPTAFCSYSGEALDKKTPLLRSMATLNNQARRILRLFGKDVPRVTTTLGAEQEYFLVDRAMYEAREDLMLCGRTLFGALPPKGQEMDDHYFGVIKPRVFTFMQALDKELWKLGVAAKTEHNEVAPAQHELAPVFTTTNIAVDHNQLTMELMKKLAHEHGLACLLHEKPFAGVNGSGKHNNWALSTSTGVNLLDPGETPQDNLQFLLFLAAFIKAVDLYQGLLRASVASAGNDHRLGAQEAPPAIVSIYVGEELSAILDAIANDTAYQPHAPLKMELGVDTLPPFSKDNTDRNRTSPIAFTGNKFEFRMPGSSMSLSDANVVLNTAVAEVLRGYADELEQAQDFDSAVTALVRRTIRDHRRVIFDGNGYTKEWEQEAARRGLLNLRTTVDALPCYLDEKNIKLFEDHGIFSRAEVLSRYEVGLEQYCKTLRIEARTMMDMTSRQILPAVYEYEGMLAEGTSHKKVLRVSAIAENDLLHRLAALTDRIYSANETLAARLADAGRVADHQQQARFYCDLVIPAMEDLRGAVDEAEALVGRKYWPFPDYFDLLFGVN